MMPLRVTVSRPVPAKGDCTSSWAVSPGRYSSRSGTSVSVLLLDARGSGVPVPPLTQRVSSVRLRAAGVVEDGGGDAVGAADARW